MSKATKPQSEELKVLAEMPDEAINTDDIPEVIDWAGAVVGRFYRPLKKPVTLRLDADVLAWFKAQGGPYQTAINQVLREYVARQTEQR
jgi:uncharacterized protein (DUF4415 family)